MCRSQKIFFCCHVYIMRNFFFFPVTVVCQKRTFSIIFYWLKKKKKNYTQIYCKNNECEISIHGMVRFCNFNFPRITRHLVFGHERLANVILDRLKANTFSDQLLGLANSPGHIIRNVHNMKYGTVEFNDEYREKRERTTRYTSYIKCISGLNSAVSIRLGGFFSSLRSFAC